MTQRVMSFEIMLLLIAVAVSTASTVAEAVNGDTGANSRINWNTQAAITQYPFAIQLLHDAYGTGAFSLECAGTLLTTRHVLTAAHCFNYATTARRIVRGGSASTLSGGVSTYITRVITHPAFNSATLVADIALVVVQNPFVESAYLRRATVAAAGSTLAPNSNAIIIGWGAQYLGGPKSNQLMHSYAPIVSTAVCRSNYAAVNRFVSDDMLCAGTAGVGICTGDEGAPLLFNNQVHGVASWYTGCGNAYYPGVFVRVGAYTPWIQTTANST